MVSGPSGCALGSSLLCWPIRRDNWCIRTKTRAWWRSLHVGWNSWCLECSANNMASSSGGSRYALVVFCWQVGSNTLFQLIIRKNLKPFFFCFSRSTILHEKPYHHSNMFYAKKDWKVYLIFKLTTWYRSPDLRKLFSLLIHCLFSGPNFSFGRLHGSNTFYTWPLMSFI